MESFNGRLKSLIAKKKSCLCIGLDMDPKLLNTTKLEKLRDHSRLVIDATIDLAIAFKPNFAFFERCAPREMGTPRCDAFEMQS